MGNSAKLGEKLTLKQNSFINEVIEGVKETGQINGSRAVEKVYDVKSKIVAKAMASENFAKPYIMEELKKRLGEMGLGPSKIMTNIGRIANLEPQKSSTDVILKANIELLKLQGAYPDNKNQLQQVNIHQNIVSMSFDEVKKKLINLNSTNKDLMDEGGVELPTP